jgi:OOP family OmpA-OmpF porin
MQQLSIREEVAMKIRVMQFGVLMVMLLGLAPLHAAESGYWFDSSGTVWRNSAGECWRTGYWRPELIIPGVDGRVEEGAAAMRAPTDAAEAAPADEGAAAGAAPAAAAGAGAAGAAGAVGAESAGPAGAAAAGAAAGAAAAGAEAEAAAAGGGVISATEAVVNFGFDRADLTGTATGILDSLLRKAREAGRVMAVKLTGHADRIGTEEYNLDLSLRRASSVSDYLVEKGAAERQAVEIAGKGESEPLVGCEGIYGAAAIRCLAPNRRVKVILELF